MKIVTAFQQRFGFTRNEILVIAFLASALVAGVALRRLDLSPAGKKAPRFDYAASDSEFAARVRALAMLAPSGQPGPAGKGAGGKALPAPASIDLNHADSAMLVRLPGIGPAYARRIIAYRTAHGPFARVDQLVKVKGIGPATLQKLRPFVTLK